MLLHRNPLFVTALVGVALAIACGPQPIDVPEDDDEENDRGGGGTGATGQGGAFGGAFPSGGFPSGGVATGGFPSGGVASGGFPSGGTGGALPSGGAGAGGTFPQGGVAGTVATGGVAGTPATGGAAGSGTPTTCDAAFAVGADGFVRAPALSGCWSGYAYAGGDTGSTVMPTSFAMCGMGCILKVTGTVGPATAENMYAGVAYLGFNIAQPAGVTTPGTIAPTGTSLQVTYTKTAGPTNIRVQIQAGSNRWCAPLTTSPASIAYTTFNTACWDGSGTAYAKQPIEAVQLVAPGDMAAAPLDMTLVSVKDM